MRWAARNTRLFPATFLAFVGLLAAATASCTSADLREAPPDETSPRRDAGARDEVEEETASIVDGGANDGKADGGKPKPDGGGDAASSADAGDYTSVEGLSGQAFRDGLRGLIENHVSLGYDGARDAMLGLTGFDVTGGMIECVYTAQKVAPDGSRAPGNFNTEHTWPQSLGAGSEPARSDLHHLFPVDELANNARGTLPFADTDCTTTCSYNNGSKRGPLSGGSGDVFQVRTARRGDIARAIFYFAVRYQMSVEAFEENALRAWHDADPPDATEQSRNDAIEALQNNRNPFVDRPDFVARITDF